MTAHKFMTSEEAALEFADQCAYGILSMVTPDGTPYAVPLNLWRSGRCFYFHSSLTGLKIDCLRSNPQVQICFVSRSDVIPKAMTTNFSSAIISGTAEEITDPGEKQAALMAMCSRFAVPEGHPAMQAGFASCLPRTAIWQIRAEKITGKSRG